VAIASRPERNPLKPSAYVKVQFLGPKQQLWRVKGLLDSGNLTNAAAAMTYKLAQNLGLKVKPCQVRVGTASKTGSLQVVGEVHNVKMAMGKLVVSLYRVLVIRDLNSELNLSLSFLKSIKADLNFNKKQMTVAGYQIPIITAMQTERSREVESNASSGVDITRDNEPKGGGWYPW